MSLTSLIKKRPDISNFLVSRIKEIPKLPKLGRGIFPKTLNFTQIGTAYDYAFRFELLRKYPFAKEETWVAEKGMQLINNSPYPFIKKWQRPGLRTLNATKKARQEYYDNPTDRNLRNIVEMCFRLVHLDTVYREFRVPVGQIPDDGLLPGPEKQDISDVVAMLRNSKKFMDSERFSESSSIALNPTFGHYSELVEGADADIITSSSLIDLKTSSHPSIDRNELAQIVGYFMLMQMNNANPLKAPERSISKFPLVNEIGLFYPRFAAEYMISAESISITRDDMDSFSKLIQNPPVVEESPFQKLRLIGYVRSNKLIDMGITTIEELAQILTFKGIEKNIGGMSLSRVSSIARGYLDHVIELREGITRKQAMTQFEFNDEVYLDIETTGLTSDSQIWLIGMLFKKSNELILLFAHGPDEEKSILEKYLKIVPKIKGKILTFSGHDFDENFIKERLKFYKLWKKSPRPFFIDVLTVIRDTVYIPVSNNLKDMASWMGYHFKHPDLSGAVMPRLYMEYLITQDEELLENLKEYNEDDIRSLAHVVDFLKEALSG